ncbi:MAG: ATP-binding protein [Bryobacteraceae bacterium]|jgi:predicted AAA+ superfamily ATPase
MIPRTLAASLRKAASGFPVVTVTGPRQSGKTTLVRSEFRDYAYVSLELPDQRAFAMEDPRGFLAQFNGPVILDEAQRAPDLFSYLQAEVDEKQVPGQFILTGSQNFLLLERISQSLAGRCAVLHLLPFSLAELTGRAPVSLDGFGAWAARKLHTPPFGLFELLHAGLYPRIHDQHLAPREWLAAYYQTYVERDVRNVLHVGDLETFGRFVRLCAGRSGQLLNLSGLAADCGVTHTTARRWLSVLEASFVILLLRPHHENFGKRLIKTPKLHFLDTGLLCFLLGIRTAAEIEVHSSRGAVFESFVVSELYKNFLHRGEQPGLYFWRSAAGHEVDVLVELGSRRIPVEIKSAQTVAGDFLAGLSYWRDLAGDQSGRAALVYGGDRYFRQGGAVVYPWFAL